MPNWCNTQIEIKNENIGELQTFADKLEDWTSCNYIDNGFGLNWLGNVVGNAGIYEDVNCRGVVEYFYITDDSLIIDTETAWQPMLKMWELLLAKYLPEAILYFEAEECGFGLYATNKEDLEGQYLIGWVDEDVPELEAFSAIVESGCREVTTDFLIGALQNLLKSEEKDIKKLLEELNASDYSVSMSIYQWEASTPSDWD